MIIPVSHLDFIQQEYQLGPIREIETIKGGHIHKSFKLTNENETYLLQHLNTQVFPDTQIIFENVAQVQLSLERALGKAYPYRWFLTKDQIPFVQIEDLRYRLLNFIDDSKSFSFCPEEKIASEAGRILGETHRHTYRISPDTLHDIIPNFHDMVFRIHQLEEAVHIHQGNRLNDVVDQLFYINEEREMWLDLSKQIRNKEIVMHATHNDPKLENILFDQSQRGICLIDLDTIMSGCYLFDVGDLLRSCCSPYTEDDPKAYMDAFNFDFFKAIISDYADETKELLHVSEWRPLASSGLYMTFIMAVRFLTDYLNGDVYYQVDHQKHNLHRCLNQLNLYKRMKSFLSEMEEFVRHCFAN